MIITVFDWETTGLLKPEGNDIAVQPHGTQLYAIQIDEETEETLVEIETYLKPPVPIPDFLVKQIGISNEMVANAPIFAELYQEIADVFFGSHMAIAHNLSFDKYILIYELMRIGKEFDFPYPPINFCTVEQSMHIRGHRLKNSELYEIATGREMQGAHVAKNDVLATYQSYKWLKSQRNK